MDSRMLLRAAASVGIASVNALGIAVVIPIVISAGGCDRSAQTSAHMAGQPSEPTTKPIVAVVTTQPADPAATTAAYPMRPPSYLTLDGREWAFPAAKLAVIGRGGGGYGGGFTLRLCSDDPPTAIDPGYAGNSYVLDLRLSIDHLSELPAATWDFKHDDAREDPNDSTSGIYLHGYQEQYHPDDVHVSFAKNGDELLTYISGTFLHSDPANPVAPPEHVQVNGCLHTAMPAE